MRARINAWNNPTHILQHIQTFLLSNLLQDVLSRLEALSPRNTKKEVEVDIFHFSDPDMNENTNKSMRKTPHIYPNTSKNSYFHTCIRMSYRD